MFGQRVLDKTQTRPKIPIDQAMRVVKLRHGKSILSQLLESVRLYFGYGQLSLQEYYYYRLYDDNVLRFAAKQQFVGHRTQVIINRICNNEKWRAITDDKFMFGALFKNLGFPVPKTVAIYDTSSRNFVNVPTLRNHKQLLEFFRTKAPYPLFSKPISGMRSVGTARIHEYKANTEEIVLHDGQTVPAEQYINELHGLADSYVFQEVLRPHKFIQTICGDRIASVRMVVLAGKTGSEIMRSLWKIPRAKNSTDNFWRPGNMLASVDLGTGRVERVIKSVGPNQDEIETHPDSGKRLKGIEIPHWQSCKALCLAAARVLPEVRIQSWDIAVCEDGPVLQEVNAGGDYNLPQLATNAGMLDCKFQSFLDVVAPTWRKAVAKSILRRTIGISVKTMRRHLVQKSLVRRRQ